MSSLQKRFYRFGILVAAAWVAGVGAATAASVATTLGAGDKRELQREVRLIIDLLQNYHYADRSFHEIEGSEIVGRFLDALDAHGAVLTAADGEFLFRRFGRNLKTVYLQKGDVQPAFEIFDFFAARAEERLAWIEQRLAGEFDFTVDETLPPQDDEPPADRAAADRRWERRLKNQIIGEMLAGRDQVAAIAAVRKSYQQWRRQLQAMDALVVRERFLETLVNLFDPHSGYFSAESTREFEVEMEGAVGGVGLDLRKEDGRCVVAAVRAGGPAEAQGEILPGDHVIAVADGDGEFVATRVKRMRELAAVLRGAPGTKVRLMVAAADASADDPGKEIVLERARVILPEERARGRLYAVPGKAGRSRRVGWIELPSFYAAGEEAKAASATRDVRALLETMQMRGLDALVLDLRKNPGGAMTEAVALAGLFIPEGTVLATRDLEGKIAVTTTGPAPVAFAGPLVVLTSPGSASASEIFAGAMRFHRRALVVGGVSTYGKGTVQIYVELEKLPARGTGGPAWGTLRLTSQQFFFPDGAPVQRTGAASHLVLPDADERAITRESELPHALRAESINVPGVARATGDFAAVSDELVAHLRARLDARAAVLPEFALAKERQALIAEVATTDQGASLVLERRRAGQAQRAAKLRALRQARWKLAREAAWPVEPVDTAEVQAALEAQVAVMRPRLWPEGEIPAGRVAGQQYWWLEPDGRLGRADLDVVPYRDFADDADATVRLAEAFRAVVEVELEPAVLAEVLREVALLEPVTVRVVRACFARRLPEGTDAAAVARGVDAVLRCAAEIDGSWRGPGPVLDVNARESIRLASDWCDWQEDRPAAPLPSPAGSPASVPVP